MEENNTHGNEGKLTDIIFGETGNDALLALRQTDNQEKTYFGDFLSEIGAVHINTDDFSVDYYKLGNGTLCVVPSPSPNQPDVVEYNPKGEGCLRGDEIKSISIIEDIIGAEHIHTDNFSIDYYKLGNGTLCVVPSPSPGQPDVVEYNPEGEGCLRGDEIFTLPNIPVF